MLLTSYTLTGISLDSSDSNSTFDEHIPIKLTVDTSRRSNFGLVEPASANSISTPLTGSVAEKRRLRRESTSEGFYNHRRLSSSSSTSSEVIHQYKLTREDSERPIASEKIKKRADPQDNNPKNVYEYYCRLSLRILTNNNSLKQEQWALCLYSVIIKESLDSRKKGQNIIVITAMYITRATCK